MMYTYTGTGRGGATKIRHAPCRIVPREFYARLPVTDHRYAPGVTKTKGILADTRYRLPLEIETGAASKVFRLVNLFPSDTDTHTYTRGWRLFLPHSFSFAPRR